MIPAVDGFAGCATALGTWKLQTARLKLDSVLEFHKNPLHRLSNTGEGAEREARLRTPAMNSPKSTKQNKQESMFDSRSVVTPAFEPTTLLAELTLKLAETRETVQRIEAAKTVSQETMQLEVSI